MFCWIFGCSFLLLLLTISFLISKSQLQKCCSLGEIQPRQRDRETKTGGKYPPDLGKISSRPGENFFQTWGKYPPDLGKISSSSGEKFLQIWGKYPQDLGKISSRPGEYNSCYSLLRETAVDK